MKGLLSFCVEGLEADDDAGNFQIMQKRISPQLAESVILLLLFWYFLGKHYKEKKFAVIILGREEIT